MINWKKYIDHIYILTCTKRNKDIYNYFLKELKRVYIDINDIDFVTIFTNINYPIYDCIYNKYFVDYTEVMSQRNYALECTLGHYYLMKLAEFNNDERILILEDDVCFLKNTVLIENILDKVISQFNNNLDVCILGQANYPNDNEINIKLFDHQTFSIGGAICNIYNKKAYKSFINYIENDKVNSVIDEYYMFDQALSFGMPNISISGECRGNLFKFDTNLYYNFIKQNNENIINYYNLLCNGYWMKGITQNELYINFCKYLEYYNIVDKFPNEYNDIKNKII